MLGSETARLFVINWKYIRPLKVLLYSLMVNKSLQGCPIEIVTDDPKVIKDKFLSSVAQNIELVTDDTLARFRTINGGKIEQRRNVTFAPKYTFLKFVAYMNRGYTRHVVMDADMLCLNPFDEQLLASDVDSMAMREISSSSFPIRDEPKVMTFSRDRAIELVAEASLPVEVDYIEGINSGFMVLSGKAISNDVFNAALEIATAEAFTGEQAATTEVLRRIVKGRHIKLPIWYNARRRVFECLGEDFFRKHMRDIILFHYTPGKPWTAKPENQIFLDKIWYDWEAASREWVNDMSTKMI